MRLLYTFKASLIIDWNLDDEAVVEQFRDMIERREFQVIRAKEDDGG